jgi:hypothetical protein
LIGDYGDMWTWLKQCESIEFKDTEVKKKKGYYACQCLGNYDYIAYSSLNSGECKRVSQVAIWMNGATYITLIIEVVLPHCDLFCGNSSNQRTRTIGSNILSIWARPKENSHERIIFYHCHDNKKEIKKEL